MDICCIKKESDTELSETIIFIFRWYHNTAQCYIYLSDISISNYNNNDQSQHWWKPAFRKSRWFIRNWTFQELLVPEFIEFFFHEDEFFSNKKALEQQIHEITEIPIKVLQEILLSNFSIDKKISWIEIYETKYKENKTYFLFGIFDIFLYVQYDKEKNKVFCQLKQQLYQDN